MPISENLLPASGPKLSRAFEALVTTLNGRHVRYAIIGGLALIQHTRPRATDDIDALLTVSALDLPGLFEALRDRGFQVDLQRNIREFRDDGMTTLQFDEVLVDLLRSAIPSYANVLDRAVTARILGHDVRISSPEGLIVTKLMAMRPQDEVDIQEILATYSGRLDLDFIRTELRTFAEIDDPRWAKLEAWLVKK